MKKHIRQRKGSKTCRFCCFTINNPTDEERARLLLETQKASYLVYQEEQGENGTRHIQGYIEFTSPKRFTTLKKSVAFGRAHLERRKGSAQQASDYCKKKETRLEGTEPVELGKISKQGQRNDLKNIKLMLDEGASHKSFTEYRNLDPPAIRDVEVIILFGAPGTGKSRWAYRTFPDLWSKPPGPWFDTYAGQETILIDEMGGDYIDYRTLLRVTEGYPLLTPVKGSFVHLRHKRVVICSNFHPNEWYDMTRYADAGYSTFEESPLHRRINCMVELKMVRCEKRFLRVWHIGTPSTFPLSAYTHCINGVPPLGDQSSDGVEFPPKRKRSKDSEDPMDRSE